jgi:hypothetical protein
MIFNTRKVIEVKLNDLTLHIRPLDAMQQAEVLDMLVDCVDTKSVIKASQVAIGYAIDKIEGLFDEDGKAVDIKESGILGIPVDVLKLIVDEIVQAGRLEERYAKKS